MNNSLDERRRPNSCLTTASIRANINCKKERNLEVIVKKQVFFARKERKNKHASSAQKRQHK